MRQIRQTRALLFPLPFLVSLLVAILLHANSGIFGIIFIALGFCCGVYLPMGLTGRLIIHDQILTAKGVPPYSFQSRGPVNLQRLVSIYSISWRYGLTSRIGPGLLRPLIQLIDADGNEAVLGAWGWTPKSQYQALLRTAVQQSGADTDKLTKKRLGF